MDVAVTELRANLRFWLDQVRDGDEVVITERGMPVARITAIDAMSAIEELTAHGVIARPLSPERPKAAGRDLPQVGRSLSDLISEQRR
ncbi:MAG: type II toxin-antitoxin system prevent-host-death family antitoxin [bacterium]|nr:type II toxin-antitoxin system prevent-host-death family antitoxin [bacterium]